MKTSLLKLLGSWGAVWACCLLLSAAHAGEGKASGNLAVTHPADSTSSRTAALSVTTPALTAAAVTPPAGAPVPVAPAAVPPVPVAPAALTPPVVTPPTEESPPAADGGGATAHDSGKASTNEDENDDDADSLDGDARHEHHHGLGFRKHTDDVVSVGRNAELAVGEHANGVTAVLGSATTAGEVDNDVVSVLGNTRVTGGRVGHQAVAVLGNVYVNADVTGEVVAVLGNVELGPEAKVHGNITIVGGELKRDPGASVDGDVQHVLGVDWTSFDWVRPWIQRCLLYGRPLAFSPGLGWAWGIALGLLALYVFIAFVFRSAVDKCVQTLDTEPGHSILAALVLTLGLPVLFVLLFITVLGIAAVPFLAIAVICAAMFGKVVILAAIGKRCTPSLANDPAAHAPVGVLVGGLILLVIYTIPVVGFVVYKLLELLGLGVVAYTLLLTVRTQRLARSGGPGPVPGPGPGPEPGLASGSESPGANASAGDMEASGGIASGGGAASHGGPAYGSATGASAERSSADHLSGANAGGTGAAGANFGVGGQGSVDADGSGTNTPGGGPPPFAGPGAARPSGSAPLNAATLPRAGFGIRMGALLLDLILIGIVTHQLRDHDIHLILLAAYGAVMWKLKGSTIGGIICGLHVVRVDGRPIDWPTAIVRALGCFLSLAVAGLGFIWIAIDSDRQGWHDKIAGTAVVRAPKGASLL